MIDRKLLRWGVHALAGIVLLGAAALAGLRMLVPELGRYKPEIAAWVSRIAERPVDFATIEAHWRGWTPVFRFTDVRLSGRKGASDELAEPLIRLADLTFSIDPLESLRSGVPQPRAITASGASLVVMRRLDGTFSVQELGKRSPAEAREWGGFAQWVLNQTNVSLFSSRILLIDEQRAMHELPLAGVTLHLEREGERYGVSGSFELPQDGRIDFAVDVDAESLASGWSGSAYVAAHEIGLQHLGLDARHLGAEGFSGLVSGAMWSTWEDARLVEAEGTVEVQSPGLVDQGRWRGFDEVSASLKLERTPAGWALAAEDLIVATSNGSWPPSNVGARWSRPQAGDAGALVVNAQFVRIEDLVALAPPTRERPVDPMSSALADASPRGTLEDLHVSAPIGERIEMEHARARGRISGLRLSPDDWPVSVDALSGQFEANREGIVVEVASGDLRVDAPQWLAQPLQGKPLTGIVTVLPSPDGIRVGFDEVSAVTQAGRIAAQGSFLAPRGGEPPELNLVLSLGQSKVAAVRDLFADRALPGPVSRWLESAMPFGDIRTARLTFRGHPSKAAFSNGTGTLEASAELAVPVLSYARDWPEISDVSAVVRVAGTRLDARIASGRILGSGVRKTRVTIDDMAAEVPVLQVEGTVEGDSAHAMRYLAQSPLRARFKPLIEFFSIRGDSSLDIRLSLALKGRDRSATVEGEISLDNNRIDLRRLGRGPEAVNGVIAFDGAVVESDAITATWLGEPLRVVIGPSPESSGVTRVSMNGRLTPRLIATYLDGASPVAAPSGAGSELRARIDGSAAWGAVVDIPHAGTQRSVKLRAVTDLEGISLELPPPFGKESATVRRLSVQSSVSPGAERIAEIRHGDLASAVLQFVPDAGKLRLDRGTVVLGGGDAKLSEAPGLAVHGVLPTLDTGAWRTLLTEIAALGAARRDAPQADASLFGRLREVTVDAGSVVALGTRFPDTRIRATPDEDGGWRLALDGHRLEGMVRLPRDSSVEPIVADFKRVELEFDSAGSGNEPRRADPRTLPAVAFSARHFVLGERDLGHVRFTASPSEQGSRFELLELRNDAFDAHVTGTWSLAGEGHRTEFVMRMHADVLGRMLGSFGFDGSVVRGGKTDISFRGSWAGAPADFALERLTGVLHFLSTDGRLTRLEPGVTGRVFGLLTITSLPRRLILDFGDLFKNGFEYDRIDGSFAIENGHAYTDDLFMESDTARFEIVGRTGLVAEDYDQLVTVIPKISSSLPLVPLWIAQKILNRNVFDKAFSYQYTIAGAWDEPEVELVKTRSRTDDVEE